MANTIKLILPVGMELAEAEQYIKMVDSKNLAELEITIDGNEIILNPKYYTITRTRRITGYLSNVNNFNYAKQAEEKDRVKHICL